MFSIVLPALGVMSKDVSQGQMQPLPYAARKTENEKHEELPLVLCHQNVYSWN